MTVDQAIFRCCFVGGGSLFDPSNTQIQEGDPTDGEVFACMFPGLSRLHRPGGVKTGMHGAYPQVIEVMVVKPMVKLVPAFQANQRIKDLNIYRHGDAVNQETRLDFSQSPPEGGSCNGEASVVPGEQKLEE